MTNGKSNKNLRKALRYKLENMREETKKMYSELNIIHSYCKYRNDSETVDNIIHMLKELVDKAEDIDRNLCEILNADSKQVSEFLSHIVPLNYDEYDVQD